MDWIRTQHFPFSLNPSNAPCKHCGPMSQKPRLWIQDMISLIQDARPAAPPIGLFSGQCYEDAKQVKPQPIKTLFWDENLLLTVTIYLFLANLWKWRNRTNRDGAASDPNDPFGDIEDPSKQCLDINCYEPVVWDDGQVWNSLLWHLQTCCSCRRRCAGTGPRASASPGVRRFANRWTFQLFNLSLRHKCSVEGSETQHARHLFRTNSIAFSPSMYSIFWLGGLWRVQPGRIHGVHHWWDKPGAEGWPGGEKKISLRFWPTYTSGGGWGFHPADLWHQTHHYHWAQGEARVWKSGKGSRSSAYLQHARPKTENLATATFP